MAETILVSAFACRPFEGSNAGIGWKWTIELAKHFEVHVLTSGVGNKKQILGVMKGQENPTFHFIDFPWPYNKKVDRFYLERPHYVIWQFLALWHARKLVKQYGFDLIHHLTWDGIRFPTYLGLLGIPTVVGPIGGGEDAPWALRKGFPLTEIARFLLRRLSNFYTKYDPIKRYLFNKCSILILKNPSSYNLFVHYRVPKLQFLEMGTQNCNTLPRAMPPDDQNVPFRILYVGRLLGWKGLIISLYVISRLKRLGYNIVFDVVGAGSLLPRLEHYVRQFGLEAQVTFHGRVPHRTIDTYYRSCNLFLFLSFQDSTGHVVLEAIENSVPVVCLDVGGPGEIVDEKCGIKVNPNLAWNDLIAHSANEIGRLIRDKSHYEFLSRGCQARCQELAFTHLVDRMIKVYEDVTP